MLSTLDKYILGKYLRTFFFVVLIFSLLAGIIDFSEKIDEFIEEPVTLREILFDYYLNFFPHINALLWPLYALIAVIFFTSRMASNSEMIAILNAGVSFRRLMRPYLLAATIIALLHLLGNHWVVPSGNKRRIHFENTYIFKNNDRGKTDNVHLFIGPEDKVYIQQYFKADTSARGFQMETIREGEIQRILSADRIELRSPPNTWRLQGVSIHEFDGMRERITRRDELDTLLDLSPNDFVNFVNAREAMTSPELQAYIDKQRARGQGNTRAFQIEQQRRSAEPFTIYILTLIGTIMAARKVRGGLGLHLALGAGLGAIYILLSKFSVTFASNGAVAPWLGVWIPNFLFTAIVAYLLPKAQQ